MVTYCPAPMVTMVTHCPVTMATYQFLSLMLVPDPESVLLATLVNPVREDTEDVEERVEDLVSLIREVLEGVTSVGGLTNFTCGENILLWRRIIGSFGIGEKI